MPEKRLNLFEVLGGGKVYQRVEGGKLYLYLWLSKKRKQFRKCLETSDKRAASEKASEVVFDFLKRQSAGHGLGMTPLGVPHLPDCSPCRRRTACVDEFQRTLWSVTTPKELADTGLQVVETDLE